MKEERTEAIYIRVGNWINGVLYLPSAPAARRKTAVLVMHSDADYLQFPAGPALARHGYTVLQANVSRAQQPLDKKLLDVKECVEFLKGRKGIERIVLLGHSGGATLMSAYQAVAENGTAVFSDSNKIIPCGSTGPLPAADAVLLIDSNWGNGAMTLMSIDPAVVDDGDGLRIDHTYDLQNGFNEETGRYDEAFLRRYEKAQAARNGRLIGFALERLNAIESGKGRYFEDEPFTVAGASQIAPNNKLFPQDLHLFAHTKNAWPLLHGDGSVTNQIVPSVRTARGLRSFTGSFGMGAMQTSIRQYLTSGAVRTTEDFGYGETGVSGVDWDSCWCCTPGNVKHIRVPLLLMGMTGGCEYLASEVIAENAASADKTVAFVEGATHMLYPAKDSEAFPGQYGDTIKTLFAFISDWLNRQT